MYICKCVGKWPHAVLATKSYSHLNHSILWLWPHPNGSCMVMKPKVTTRGRTCEMAGAEEAAWREREGAAFAGGGETGWSNVLLWTWKQWAGLGVSREQWCLTSEKRGQGPGVPTSGGPARRPQACCALLCGRTGVQADDCEDILDCFVTLPEESPILKQLRMFPSCNQHKPLTVLS